MSHRVPSYRCKKVSGRKYACVSLPDGRGGRRDVLLGRHGTKESKVEYARVIAEWQAGARLPRSAERSATDLTVNEMLAAYVPHAEQHYRLGDGTPSTELYDMK